MWKNRLGFARLAIQHGYPIVPFASVGAEHGIDIVLDNESPLLAPVQFLAEKLLGTKDGPALVRGVGLTPVPRPNGSITGSASQSTPQSLWGSKPTITPHAGCASVPPPLSNTASS